MFASKRSSRSVRTYALDSRIPLRIPASSRAGDCPPASSPCHPILTLYAVRSRSSRRLRIRRSPCRCWRLQAGKSRRSKDGSQIGTQISRIETAALDLYPDITNAVLQDRKIFEEALRRASERGTVLSSNQCLYVGDSIKCDVQGAMQVETRNHPPPEFDLNPKPPDFDLDSPTPRLSYPASLEERGREGERESKK